MPMRRDVAGWANEASARPVFALAGPLVTERGIGRPEFSGERQALAVGLGMDLTKASTLAPNAQSVGSADRLSSCA
jgi:hypothetical protein